MLYSFQNLFYVLFIAAVVTDAASGEGLGARHDRESSNVRQYAAEVRGLDFFQTYVCSPCSTNVKRQTSTDSSATIINIPVSDLPALYLELQSLKAETTNRMIAEGLLRVKRNIWSIFSKRTGTAETVPLQVSGLDILKTYVCPSCSAKRQTSFYITNIRLNIPAGDLPGLLKIINAIINQIMQLLASYGITVPTNTVIPEIPAGTTTAVAATSPQITEPAITTVQPEIPVSETLAPQTSDQTSDACPATITIDKTTTVGSGAIVDATSTTAAPNVDASSTAPGGIFVEIPASSSSTLTVTTFRTSTTTIISANPATSTAIEIPGTAPYVFNRESSRNIAVYFGQTPVTGGTTLANQCADANIDIVVLAFVIARNYNGGAYPQVNFGAACGGQTPLMMQQAPGLLFCPELAGHISTCQKTYGKKVFLSIGGATSGVYFNSDSEAVDFGNVLWNLFGPPGNIDDNLRPFGDQVIDGFDFDNENNMPQHYELLAQTLRSNFASSTTKSYYLSSAPQCPFPDQSNPQGVLLLCDFVFVQFYNNPPCEIGTAGFIASVELWSSALRQSALSPQPRLYIGAPAWSLAGPSAYTNIGSPKGMMNVAQQVKQLGLPNFGGLMYWDGPEGLLNIEAGQDIISWGKDGL